MKPKNYLYLWLCLLCQLTALPVYSQQVQVAPDEKKLYDERCESLIKNFFSSLETFRELDMDDGLLLEIQRNNMWMGSNNTTRLYEDFTQVSGNKAYKQQDVRTYMRNYCLSFDNNAEVYITIEDIRCGPLYREGDHYYMKVRFKRDLDYKNTRYSFPLEAVCNFSPGLNNINRGGIQSIDKINSDFADNSRSTSTGSGLHGTSGNSSGGRTSVSGTGSKDISLRTRRYDKRKRSNLTREEKQLFRQGLAFFKQNNYMEAEKFFRQLSHLPESYYYLGNIYAFGRETKDPFLGCYYITECANGGDMSSMNNLGILYEEGNYVKKNYEKAFQCFNTAAQAKNAMGMYNVGRCYYIGIGVERDYAVAVEWFAKSFNANQNPQSALYLGMCCYYGAGTKVDYEFAVECLRYAKQGGCGDEQLLREAEKKWQETKQ